MSNKIISHPRLIEQREKELEEYEKQIEIKRIALFRDMHMLTHRTKNLDALKKHSMHTAILAFAAGTVFGSIIMGLSL